MKKNHDLNGHIVFDLDGTLVSSHMPNIRAGSEVLTQWLGREVSVEEVLEKLDRNTFKFYDNFGIDIKGPETFREISQLWSDRMIERINEIQLFPGVMDLLKDLKESPHTLYIWTARDRPSTLAILKALGMMPFFETVMTSDEMEQKPHPDGLFKLVGGHPREEVLVIGDSYTDGEGAVSFGCSMMGVLWCEYAEKDPLVGSGAQYLAHTPEECGELIKEIFHEKGNGKK